MTSQKKIENDVLQTERADSEGDVEKGSVHVETRRQSLEEWRKREDPRSTAVVRVEVHDTGVGLRKQDVLE